MTKIDRNQPRVRTLLRGRLEYNEGKMTLDCLIRDLSASGARLEVSDIVSLPQTFRLYVPKQDKRYNATVRWHRDGQIGVAFASDATVTAVESPADRIERLEAEVVKLRGVIAAIRADPSRARLLIDHAA